MSLFHERGYDGVGVAELAKAIGVNPPSLYAAFGSKYGLFERAIERYAGGDGGFIADVLDRSRDPKEAIEQVFFRAADVFANDRNRQGCLVMDGARNSADPQASALTSACRARTRDMLETWFADRGLRDAEPLADALMIGLAGLSAAARDGMPKDALREAAGVLVTGLTTSLVSAEGPRSS